MVKLKEGIQRVKLFINENPQRKKLLLIIFILAIIPITVISALTVQSLRQHAAKDETFGASVRIYDYKGEEILNSISDPNVFISIFIDRAVWSRWAIPDQPSANNGLVKNAYAVTPAPNINDCSNAAGLCRYSCLAGETLKSSPECQSADNRLVCCIASSATLTPTPKPTPPPTPNINDCSNAVGLCRYSCLAGEILKSSPECQSADNRLVCCIASSATLTPTPTPTPKPAVVQGFVLYANSFQVPPGQTVVRVPGGTVTLSPAPQSNGTYPPGSTVFLKVTPDNPYSAISWTGVDSFQDNTATVEMTGERMPYANIHPVSSTSAGGSTASASPTPTPVPTSPTPTPTPDPAPTPTKHILRAVYIENYDRRSDITGGSAPIKIVVKSRKDITRIPWKLNDASPDLPEANWFRTVQVTLIGDELALPISTFTTLTNYPTPTPYPNASKNLDLNNDGVVNCKDTRILTSQYGQKGAALSTDFNHDGIIDGTDLNTILRNYTPGDTTKCAQ